MIQQLADDSASSDAPGLALRTASTAVPDDKINLDRLEAAFAANAPSR